VPAALAGDVFLGKSSSLLSAVEFDKHGLSATQGNDKATEKLRTARPTESILADSIEMVWFNDPIGSSLEPDA